jgi:EAL domain-containing protein (putative c-di-GMP-specific phosphodiesterase class I)
MSSRSGLAGAGFASLRHILRLEPDIIKLDISLIRDINIDTARRALARGLISFGSEIGATIVGEGVETESELEALIELGVCRGQGYFLGRPESIEVLTSAVRVRGAGIAVGGFN